MDAFIPIDSYLRSLTHIATTQHG